LDHIIRLANGSSILIHLTSRPVLFSSDDQEVWLSERVFPVPAPVCSLLIRFRILVIAPLTQPVIVFCNSFSVTLAWDDKDDLAAAFKKLRLDNLTYLPPYLGLGRVGPYGTVLKGGGWGQFPVNTNQ
jgi:hypothetical protein